MTITVTYETLLESTDALRQLSDMSIPVRTALKFRKILRHVQDDLDTVQDLLKKMAEKHAKKLSVVQPDGTCKDEVAHPLVKQEDGTSIPDENRVEIEDKKAYEADRNELLETSIEIPFELVKVADLNDPKDPPLKLKTSLVFALDWLLDE